MSLQTPETPDSFAPHKDVDVRKEITRGGVWIFVGRWLIRSIGILSTIILARLLSPEDFGLMAICLLVIGLAETIGREGQSLAVIRQQNLDREFVDSAWTASIITGVTLGSGVFLMAPVVASMFNEPRAVLLIHILSISVFIMGLENIGLAINRKKFDFANDIKYRALEKVIPVTITLTTAYFVRNYWALVAGTIGGYIGVIISSYILSNYRPKICFKRIREVWSFSLWVVLEKFALFCSMRVDQLFIPSFGGGATQIGHYHVGSELARMPVSEIFMPIDRVLIPAYSQLQSNAFELMKAYINTLSVAAIICLPVGIGFSLIAGDAVRVVYGEKWIPMIPVVELIAISSVSVALISTITPVLNVLGRSKVSAALLCLQVLLLLGGFFLSRNHLGDISDVAWVRLITVSLTLPVALICLRIIVSIRFMDMLKVFWRPLIAIAAMALTLTLLLPPDMDIPVAARLALRIIAGGFVYAAVLNLLWLVCGKPPGAENAFWRFVSTRLQR